MDKPLTERDKAIKKMESYPLGCRVVNLKLGIQCAYKALTCREINDHEKKHINSWYG